MSSLCGSLMTTQRMYGNGNVLLLPLLFLASTAVCRSQETHPPPKTHWLGNESDEQQDFGISSWRYSGRALGVCERCLIKDFASRKWLQRESPFWNFPLGCVSVVGFWICWRAPNPKNKCERLLTPGLKLFKIGKYSSASKLPKCVLSDGWQCSMALKIVLNARVLQLLNPICGSSTWALECWVVLVYMQA
jgi:hypothetical protein